MASTSSAYEAESEVSSIFASTGKNTATEDDFEQTIELLEVNAVELTEEISCSVEEVSMVLIQYEAKYVRYNICRLFMF